MARRLLSNNDEALGVKMALLLLKVLV